MRNQADVGADKELCLNHLCYCTYRHIYESLPPLYVPQPMFYLVPTKDIPSSDLIMTFFQ